MANMITAPRWKTGLIAAALSMIPTAIVLWFPKPWAIALLAVSAIVFFYVLRTDPVGRYWRMFCWLASGWVTSRLIPTVILHGTWKEGQFGYSMDASVSPVYDICMLVVLISLLVLDFRSRNSSERRSPFWNWSRKSTSQVQNASGSHSMQTQIGNVSGDGNQINVVQGFTADDLKIVLGIGIESARIPVSRSTSADAEIVRARSSLEAGDAPTAKVLLSHLREQCWNDLKSRERFRWHVAMGDACQILEDWTDSSSNYLDAIQYQPDEEESQSLEPMAYFLLKEDDKAFEAANRVLAKFPNSERASAIRIRSAPANVTSDSLENSIPSQLRDSGEILFALATRALRYNNPARAESLFRKALKKHPDSTVAQEQLATAIAATESSDKLRNSTDNVTPESLVRLDEACDLIAKVFEKRRTPSLESVARLRQIRAVAHSLAGRDDLAETDFRLALEASPDDATIAVQYARLLFNLDRSDAAITVLQSVSRHTEDVDARVMLANLLGDRNKPGDHAEAIGLLSPLIPLLDTINPIELRTIIPVALTRLHSMHDAHSVALAICDDLSEQALPAAIRFAIKADTLRRSGSIPEAKDASLLPSARPMSRTEVVHSGSSAV